MSLGQIVSIRCSLATELPEDEAACCFAQYCFLRSPRLSHNLTPTLAQLVEVQRDIFLPPKATVSDLASAAQTMAATSAIGRSEKMNPSFPTS
jgi:hypothetical protein